MTPRFYLGTHKPGWLAQTDVPLFVSRRRLAERKTLPRALGQWALDSGGFTELDMFGGWETSPQQYADEARHFQDRVGNLAFAAIQDWMCEPFMLEKTGKSVGEHQTLTIESWITLNSLAPNVPWIPVIQGWEVNDYLDHVKQYARAGVDLTELPTVGVGSVCRRQGTDEAAQIFAELHDLGIRLHGFGLKVNGLKKCSIFLASSDSMAWSVRARKTNPLAGCTHKHCNNCLRFALRWREKVLEASSKPCQGRMTWGHDD